MKTTKLIIALSVILVAALTGYVNAQSAGKPLPVRQQVTDPICYTVQIANAWVLNGSKTTYLVCMRDGTGRLIAPAQVFRPGMSYYNFFEKGPVRGTRSAQVITSVDKTDNWTAISSRNGYFFPATCYLFLLKLQPGSEPGGINKE